MRPHSSGASIRLAPWFPLLALAFTAFVVLLLVSPHLLSLTFKVSKNYNEGWNAFQALRALGPKSLYPPLTSFLTVNYTPLSFYMIGWLGKLNGDLIITGRLVSLTSILIVTLHIGLIVRTISCSNMAAVFASLLFLGQIAFWGHDYFAMNDPQWIAHAFMTTALMVAITRRPLPASLATVSFLAIVSGLIKHSLIPFPVAFTIYLYLWDRQNFMVWLQVSSVILVCTIITMYVLYGSAFFVDILFFPREFSFLSLIKKSFILLPQIFPLFCVAIFLFFISANAQRMKILYIYIATSFIWGMFITGGAGIWQSAYFDFVIGSSIVAGLCAGDRVWTSVVRNVPITRAFAMLFLIQPMIIATPTAVIEAFDWLRHGESYERDVAEDIAFLASHDGPVACETQALCYWAGKPDVLDFFSLGQKMTAGVIDRGEFGRLVMAHYFDVIQVETPKDGEIVRLGSGSYELLKQNYAIARRSRAGMMFVPKDG